MASSQNARQAQMITNNEHVIQGSMAHKSSPQGIVQASPATGIDSANFNDSGFYDYDYENDETNLHRYNYKDFILFKGDIPNLNTDNFFADLDASTKANHGSIYDGVNDEGTSLIERGAVDDSQSEQNRRTTFYDPVHEAAQQPIDQSVLDALSDFEIRSQPDYSRQSHHTPILSPLDKWYNTYERHESLAYRLEQPSNPPRPLQQQSRQPSQRSGHQSHSH
jgi:hypothetical protein